MANAAIIQFVTAIRFSPVASFQLYSQLTDRLFIILAYLELFHKYVLCLFITYDINQKREAL